MLFKKHLMGVLRDPDPNPGGGGAPPTGPTAAELAAALGPLLVEALKPINLKLTEFDAAFKAKPPAPPAPPAPPPVPPVKLDGLTPEMRALFEQQNATIAAMQKDQDGLKTQNAEAVKQARESSVRAGITEAISALPAFINKENLAAFRRIVESATTLSEDGKLIADGLPIDAFVKKQAETLGGLFAPKPTTGAGAGSGAPGGGSGIKLRGIHFDQTPAEQQARAKELLAAMQQG